MFGLYKRKLKKDYRIVERQILVYTKGKRKPYSFLLHVLCFFRKYPELCERSDYKELYDETIILLILRNQAENFWSKNNPKNQKTFIEVLADIENRYINESDEFFSLEMIDAYLTYRKKKWEKEEKYTNERYNFIL